MAGNGYGRYHNRRRKRKRKRRGKGAIGLIAVIVVFALSSGMLCAPLLKQRVYTGAAAGNGKEEIPDESVSDVGVDLAHLYSPCAVLAALEQGEILAEHDAQEKIYPASLTKIMTAVLAIEHTEDMEEAVSVPAECFARLYAEDASMAGFQPGERVCLKDLLYGILLPSGAECCMAFAEKIAGTEEGFVRMMNEKAAQLGLKNTHFCNATGLQDPDHYSTVEDISILLRYALKKEAFRSAFTSRQYRTTPSEQHPEGFTFYSTLFQDMDKIEVTGGEIIGGKTGYTDEAGLCLASLARVNGKEYLLVTAKAAGNHDTAPYHILDAVDVYSQIGRQADIMPAPCPSGERDACR